MALTGPKDTPFNINVKIDGAIPANADHIVTLYYPAGTTAGQQVTFNGATEYTFDSATWNVDQQVSVTLHTNEGTKVFLEYQVTSAYTQRIRSGVIELESSDEPPPENCCDLILTHDFIFDNDSDVATSAAVEELRCIVTSGTNSSGTIPEYCVKFTIDTDLWDWMNLYNTASPIVIACGFYYGTFHFQNVNITGPGEYTLTPEDITADIVTSDDPTFFLIFSQQEGSFHSIPEVNNINVRVPVSTSMPSFSVPICFRFGYTADVAITPCDCDEFDVNSSTATITSDGSAPACLPTTSNSNVSLLGPGGVGAICGAGACLEFQFQNNVDANTWLVVIEYCAGSYPGVWQIRATFDGIVEYRKTGVDIGDITMAACASIVTNTTIVLDLFTEAGSPCEFGLPATINLDIT